MTENGPIGLRHRSASDYARMLRECWAAHGDTALRLAVATMAVLALLKLGDEFRRLVWESGPTGATDLALRHRDVGRWFAGMPLYSEFRTASYPPASHAILWPLLGWLDLGAARWLWAASSVAMLVWLAWLLVRRSGAATRLEAVFVGLLLLSMNATGVTIGHGQLALHVLAPLLAALLLLLGPGRLDWRADLLGAALLLVATVKPHLAVPFFWTALFAPGGPRPVLLAALGYVALTLFAATFQQAGLWALLAAWLMRASGEPEKRNLAEYGDLHAGLVALGLEEWTLAGSLIVLVALGAWTYVHRHVDLWLRIGVAALVARLWTYHLLYDDVLVVLAMVTLFCLAKRGGPRGGVDLIAGLLLGVMIVLHLMPARLLIAPLPWHLMYTVGHPVAWIVVLGFLIRQAHAERSQGRRADHQPGSDLLPAVSPPVARRERKRHDVAGRAQAQERVDRCAPGGRPEMRPAEDVLAEGADVRHRPGIPIIGERERAKPRLRLSAPWIVA
jgi:hypothetical protein